MKCLVEPLRAETDGERESTHVFSLSYEFGFSSAAIPSIMTGAFLILWICIFPRVGVRIQITASRGHFLAHPVEIPPETTLAHRNLSLIQELGLHPLPFLCNFLTVFLQLLVSSLLHNTLYCLKITVSRGALIYLGIFT